MSTRRKTIEEALELNKEYVQMSWSDHARECEHCRKLINAFIDKAVKTSDEEKMQFIEHVRKSNIYEMRDVFKEAEKRLNLKGYGKGLR